MKGLLMLVLLTGTLTNTPICDERRMAQLAGKVDTIAIAEVVEVGPPPGAWSGTFAMVQRVKYRVDEVLKGSAAAGRVINVGHYVVANSPTADTEQARLCPKRFLVGNKLLVFLVPDRGTGYIAREFVDGTKHPAFLVSDESCGAIPVDDAMVRLVRRSVSKQ